jgi:sec-independent protein translocase protein TatA
VVVLILLFGAKRLPDAARALGRSMRIFKAETKSLVDDDKDLAEKADAQVARQPLPPADTQPTAPTYQPPAPPVHQPAAPPVVDQRRDN